MHKPESSRTRQVRADLNVKVYEWMVGPEEIEIPFSAADFVFTPCADNSATHVLQVPVRHGVACM